MQHVQLLGTTGQNKRERRAAINDIYHEEIYMYISVLPGITEED
jgi:hypothetical protein